MSQNEHALRIRCETCNARPGFQCRTSSGWVASYPHVARSQAVSDIWIDGYFDGARFALRYPEIAKRDVRDG